MTASYSPVVSVVTVCLNAATTIEETIKSVLDQTYPRIEYVVIDGKSQDGTLDILADYHEHVDRLLSEPDTGLYNAMNKALRLVQGDIIIFMNADDVFASEDVVERVIKVAIADPAAMIIYGDVIIRFPEGDLVHRQPAHLSKWRLWMNPVCHQTMFVRRDAFSKVGPFDESLPICADLDWLTRAVLVKRLPTVHVPVDICVFQMGGICANRVARERDKRVIRLRYYSPIERIAFSVRELLLKIWIRLRARNFSPPWRIRGFLANSLKNG